MKRTEKIFGTAITMDPVVDRNRLQEKAELGFLTPSAYYSCLRASWSSMTAADKEEEVLSLR